MGKISYIVVPKHDGRRGGAGAASAGLSSRVIANAMRLLIAVILMSALVAIIILAAHRAIDVPTAQPIQPWTLAPVPSTLGTPPPVVLKRKYILCDSELSNGEPFPSGRRFPSSYPPRPPPLGIIRYPTENNLVQPALDVSQKCAIIEVHLEVDTGQQLQSNVSKSPSRWNEFRVCSKSKASKDSKPTMYLGVLNECSKGTTTAEICFFDDQRLFHGTPFLSKWQDFFNPADPTDDLLDSLIRLMLVWRYGGLACNLQETGLLKEFGRLRKSLERERVVILMKDTSVVYSNRSCHSAVGFMLRDYDTFFPLKRKEASAAEEQIKVITGRADKEFPKSIYFVTIDPDKKTSSEELFSVQPDLDRKTSSEELLFSVQPDLDRKTSSEKFLPSTRQRDDDPLDFPTRGVLRSAARFGDFENF